MGKGLGGGFEVRRVRYVLIGLNGSNGNRFGGAWEEALVMVLGVIGDPVLGAEVDEEGVAE